MLRDMRKYIKALLAARSFRGQEYITYSLFMAARSSIHQKILLDGDGGFGIQGVYSSTITSVSGAFPQTDKIAEIIASCRA